ncbi:MAG: LacI family DNA-binding transcriptional regulator, partial [Planctomycetes bacterium]|nr:LacI family DNA-binding transcriptional regulator [Planctomycetota bacterium]
HGWRISDNKSELDVLFIHHHNRHVSKQIEQGLRDSLGERCTLHNASVSAPVAEWGDHPPLSVYDPQVHKLIIVYNETGVPQAFADFVHEKGGHIICLGCNLHENYDTICGDFSHMSRMLVKYVYERGHKHIAFVGAKDIHMRNPSYSARVLGYQQAMYKYELEPETLFLGDEFDTMYDDFARWLEKCEKKNNRPTCLYVSGPNYVSRLALVLDKLGLHIPDDLSIAGFGFQDGEHNITGFDSYVKIIQPWYKMGLITGQRVQGYISSRDRILNCLTLVPSRITHGNSVRRLS